jgi:SAM-dependent methyltransferase
MITLDEKLDSCPVCETPSVSDGWAVVKYPPKLELPDLYYSKCWRCGILYLNPRMSEQETKRFYAEDYRDVLDKMYPVYSLQLDKSRQFARATCIKEQVGNATVTSHLDVGSSQGVLLRKINAVVSVGLEWNDDERYTCNHSGQTIYEDFHDLPELKYDLITLIQVLEHVNYPVEFLLNLKSRLAVGGRLFIEIPNGALNPMAVPWHPLAFNSASLKFLLDECGFKLNRMIAYSGYLNNSQKPHYLLAEVTLP